MFLVVDWGAVRVTWTPGDGRADGPRDGHERRVVAALAGHRSHDLSRGTPTFFFFLAAKSLDSSTGSSFGFSCVAGLSPSAAPVCTSIGESTVVLPESNDARTADRHAVELASRRWRRVDGAAVEKTRRDELIHAPTPQRGHAVRVELAVLRRLVHRAARVEAELLHLEVGLQFVPTGAAFAASWTGVVGFDAAFLLRRKWITKGKASPLDGVRQQLVAVVRREEAVAAPLDIIFFLKKGRLADAHDLVSTL